MFPLTVERTYIADRDGGKWYFNHIKRVAIAESVSGTQRSVIFRRGDGSALYFVGDNTNGFQPASPENGYSVQRSTPYGNEIWTLTSPSGEIEIYDAMGYITSHTLPNGLVHTYNYSLGSTSTITITDSATNNQLVYTLDDSKTSAMDPVTSIQLPGGAVLQFTYMNKWPVSGATGNGLLETVTYPAVGGQSAVKTYRYADNNGDGTTSDAERESYGTFLTGILEGTFLTGILEDGAQYASWRYDSAKRANWSEHGSANSGIERTQLSYTLNSGRISSVTTTNAAGLNTVREYVQVNGKNRVKKIAGQASGSCLASNTEYTYDANGYRDTATDTSGNVTQTLRDTEGRVLEHITAQTWASGIGSSLQQTPQSQKVVTAYHGDTTLPASKTYYGYTSSSWAAYRSEAFTYDANKRVDSRTETDLINSVPRTWDYTTTYRSGTVIPQTIVVDGPLSGATDAATYTYNTVGQLTSIALPTVNSVTQTATYADYNSFGLPETITDANGIVTTLAYDARGRLTNSSAGGAVTQISYWPNGLAKRITTPDGAYLEYSYNSAHQLTSVVNQLGERVDYTPSVLNGQWTSAITKNSASTVVTQQHRVFDALGRLWKQQDTAQVDKTVLNYDANDNLRFVITLGDTGNTPAYDNGSRVVSRSYDAQNRLASESLCTDSTTPTAPYSCASPLATTIYTYDDQGNIKTVTDANNHTTTYTYNGFGELETQVSPDTGTTQYTYDAAGNLATRTKGFGTADAQQILYTWDALNRLTGINYPGTAQDVTYNYDEAGHGAGIGRLTSVEDGAGNTTSYQYDALGNVTLKTETGAITLVTEYHYSTAGVLEWIQYPGAQKVTVDSAGGQVASLKDGNATSAFISNITHQPFGGITGWKTETPLIDLYIRNFDADGRVSQWGIGASSQGTSRMHALQYDAYGNISAVLNLADANQNEVYEYDAQSRLSKVTAEYGRMTYSYDAVGNRLGKLFERKDPATQVWEEFYTEVYGISSTSNQLNSITRKHGTDTLRTRSFGYDSRGNITQDVRQPNGGTAKTYWLNYGNSDRLNSIDAP